MYVITKDMGGGDDAKIQVSFWEGDEMQHMITVAIGDPLMYDGSTGINLEAMRKVRQVLPDIQTEMIAALDEALRPENDPRARTPKIM